MPGFTLVWSDEFDGADGSPPDPTIWKHDTGGQGWGNQEREYYTDSTDNSVIQGGHLVITAKQADASQNLSCWYGACEYTSARLLTQGLYQRQYGRFAARIQIPFGQGVWPAFWMLGANIDQLSWPTCGEIDVMENIGKEPDVIHGTVHGPTSQPGQATNDGGNTTMNAPFSGDFHTYVVDWSADAIAFSVDGGPPYFTVTPADLKSGETWVFDQPFFLLLNLAIGGTWSGDPDATTTFPQTMIVDWVRVYSKD
jgi:beta-glucanase (GH16 family)